MVAAAYLFVYSYIAALKKIINFIKRINSVLSETAPFILLRNRPFVIIKNDG